MHLFTILISCLYATVEAKLGEFSAIDMSDILNVNYMPGTLLVLESPAEKELPVKNITMENNVKYLGTFADAFATMGYHRKMMNEYLCRNYLSEQIVSEMRSTRIRRRLGHPANKSDKFNTMISRINFSIKDNLLEDEGSSNYREWLKKSTTLEDIYRHYDSAQNREASEGVKDAEELAEDFDGHLTGYGYQQTPSSSSPSKLGHSGSGGGYPYHGYPSGGMHSGGGHYSSYGGGGPYFGHSGPIFYGDGGSGHSGHGFTSHEHTSPKHHGSHEDKDKLADLFDIALTALAYLSFGMFIIQVIMCISMTNTTTAPALTMMPMSMSPTGGDNGGMTGDGMMGGGGTGNGGNTNGGGTTGGGNGDEGTTEGTNGGNAGEGATGDGNGATEGGDGGTEGGDDGTGTGGTGDTGTGGTGTGDAGDTGGGRDSFNFRAKRDIPTIAQPNNEALNELARRILISIEAALVAHQDDANCLRKTLCENNAYSRNLESNQKYWIPVWSLGMSWLSGRLVENVPSTTSMLDSLKASLLGLGKADCEIIYHDCDLGKERQKRRRRRRKRSNH